MVEDGAERDGRWLDWRKVCSVLVTCIGNYDILDGTAEHRYDEPRTRNRYIGGLALNGGEVAPKGDSELKISRFLRGP